jgi:hypothetical protein
VREIPHAEQRPCQQQKATIGAGFRISAVHSAKARIFAMQIERCIVRADDSRTLIGIIYGKRRHEASLALACSDIHRYGRL